MTAVAPPPFLAWPGWPQMRYAAGRMVLVTLWFALGYGGSDWLTSQRTWRVLVHTRFELGIPLLPGFVLAYVSIYLLFLGTPFVLRTKDAIDRLARQQVIVTGIAGVCYGLIPADLAHPAATGPGMWETLFRWADAVNLDHNLVPSLHVAMSAVSLRHFAVHAATPVRWILIFWGVSIAASTVLTHQRDLLDVAAGAALARWVGRR
jgi:hypothetical protein